MATKREPLSLEELLVKKKALEEAEQKVTFSFLTYKLNFLAEIFDTCRARSVGFKTSRRGN